MVRNPRCDILAVHSCAGEAKTLSYSVALQPGAHQPVHLLAFARVVGRPLSGILHPKEQGPYW